jgi:hypothetical protein
MNQHYQTLGLKSNASLLDIKKAYRKLALKHHPDRNTSPDSSTKFIQIQSAYDTLCKVKLGIISATQVSSNEFEEEFRADYLKREQQLHKIMDEYMDEVYNINANGKFKYGWVILASIFIAPFVPYNLFTAISQNLKGFSILFTLFFVPFCMFYGSYLIHQHLEILRKKAYVLFKDKKRAIYN